MAPRVAPAIPPDLVRQVVNSYRKEGLPPPANNEIAGNQRAKIQKLVEEYIKFTKAQGT